MRRTIILLAISFFMMSSNTFVFAEDDSLEKPTGCEVMGDVLWIRPIGFIQIGLGAAAYVLSLPVTIPLKKKEEAKEFLITYPCDYYIKRPIGAM